MYCNVFDTTTDYIAVWYHIGHCKEGRQCTAQHPWLDNWLSSKSRRQVQARCDFVWYNVWPVCLVSYVWYGMIWHGMAWYVCLVSYIYDMVTIIISGKGLFFNYVFFFRGLEQWQCDQCDQWQCDQCVSMTVCISDSVISVYQRPLSSYCDLCTMRCNLPTLPYSRGAFNCETFSPCPRGQV